MKETLVQRDDKGYEVRGQRVIEFLQEDVERNRIGMDMICYTIDLLRKCLIKPLLLLSMWLVPVGGWAVDIRNAGELKNALSGSTLSGNVVTLNADASLNSSLKIIDGVMVLDLNGKTITYDRSGTQASAGNDIGIEVNGSAADIIVRNGSIVVKAAKGENKTIKGGNGSNAFAVVLNNGKISISEMEMTAIPGTGGSGWGAGSAGSAWVLDPNGSYTLNDMIPNGAYFSFPNNVNYMESGGGINGTSATVDLTNYTVEYTTNGGTIKTQGSSSYNIETTNFTLPIVERNGCNFVNWLYNDIAVNASALPTTTTREAATHLTFVADWKLIPYKIIYKTNGGVPIAEGSYNIEKGIPALPTPFRDGFIFKGWYRNGSIVTSVPAGTGDITLDAQWAEITYSLSFESNGSTLYPPITYTKGNPGTMPTDPFKDGYLFGGWYLDVNFSGQKVTSIPFPESIAEIKKITLYAKWSPKVYRITYDPNGGANPEAKVEEYTYATKTFSLPIPTKEGYTYLGWKDGSDVIKQIKEGTYGDKSLIAQWRVAVYTLSFVTNSNGINLKNLTYSKESILSSLPDLTGKKIGYNFKGWFDNASCTGTSITASALPHPKENTNAITLYAKWEAQRHMITFETNGGTAVRSLEYTFDKECILPTKTTKIGYRLDGWYENKGFSGEAIASIKASSKDVDFILYAKWIPIEYVIKYECYYGAFLPSTVKSEKYTIESEDIPLPIPYRDVFSFVGWYDNDLLIGATQAFIKKGSIGNKTFYAKWTAGSVVSFDKPENGTITIKSVNKEIKTNESVGGGIPLKITTTSVSAIYKLSKLIVGGIPYTTTSVDTVMPATGGLTVSAEFIDPRPYASAPKITTLPENTDFIPIGADVKIILANIENGATLLYSLDNSTPKKYTEPFLVSSVTAKTLKVSAISRKDGHKDGITTRDIKFGSGKITISFNLPKGIAATNPLGGEVVSAVASGGTFQFKLDVDEDSFETMDSLRVEANGTVIKPDVWGVFTLSEQKADVTVKVAGITGTTYTIALTQKPHGRIFFTDNDSTFTQIANRGDRISVTAEADENYKFVSWTDGNQSNPREIIAESNMNLQANFVTDADHYVVVFPVMEGVTVKTLTNYSQQVKQGEACKFYLRLDADYNQSVPVVRANGEVLTVNKEVYSLFNIKNNYSISVSGIRKNKTTLKVAENVSVMDVETTTDATKLELLPEAVVNMYAKAPAGKVFLNWNDGKADNPRLSTAQDAPQLIPLFTTLASGETFSKVTFSTPVGAGVSVINANADAVKPGGELQFKIVVLPQYSGSKIKVTADDKEIQPELELRASSETTSFIYTLKGVTGEAKINVSGLVLNDYTLAIEQKAGGTVRANQSGLLKYGTEVTLSATPASGNMFVKWSDGNTLNPYPYKVVKDMTMNAVFIQSNLPVNNEIKPSLGRIYIVENTLHIDVDKPTTLCIWNYNGQLVQNAYIQAGHSTFYLSQGNYIVKTNSNPPVKISVR